MQWVGVVEKAGKLRWADSTESNIQPYNCSPFQGHMNSWFLIALPYRLNSHGSTTAWANFLSPPTHYILISITSFQYSLLPWNFLRVLLTVPSMYKTINPAGSLPYLPAQLLFCGLLRPLRWRQQVPLKHRWLFSIQCNVSSQKTWIFLNPTTKTSNLTTSISLKICNNFY
jgi:hypothetical protein